MCRSVVVSTLPLSGLEGWTGRFGTGRSVLSVTISEGRKALRGRSRRRGISKELLGLESQGKRVVLWVYSGLTVLTGDSHRRV